MVVGDDFEPVVAPTVGAAVTRPQARKVPVADKQRHDSRADDRAGPDQAGLGEQAAVGLLQSVLDRAEQGVAGGGSGNGGQGFDRRPAGHVAGVVAAHPVRDRPKSNSGVVEMGVLVQGAHDADMRPGHRPGDRSRIGEDGLRTGGHAPGLLASSSANRRA